MGWLITPFAAETLASLGHAIMLGAYFVFSMPLLGMATTSWYFREKHVLFTALCVAFTGVSIEWGQAKLCGIVWIMTNPSLAISTTPFGQWSGVLTCFGLSGILTFLSYLVIPVCPKHGRNRWIVPICALAVICCLWFGGILIENLVIIKPLRFSAMLVQPHPSRQGHDFQEDLFQLTEHELQCNNAVELVIWPEGTVQCCLPNEVDCTDMSSSNNSDHSRWIQLYSIKNALVRVFQANFLVGTSIVEREVTQTDGRVYLKDCAYNSGCIVPITGEVSFHRKTKLVPFYEHIPEWSRCLPFQVGNVNVKRGRGYWYVEGQRVDVHRFPTRNGRFCRITVAICYESWFPWLPQYHCKEPLDAICHLAYDGDFKDHPEYTQRMLLTIRLRAIETRTWQLVCTHYSGTAVIDPRGRIVKQLPPGPGVLRTDQLE